MHQDPASPLDEVVLNRCQDQPPVSMMGTRAPVGAQQTLYVTSYDHLYAVHAGDGTVRWCQQVQPTQERIKQLRDLFDRQRRHFRLPSVLFGTPRVANGVVYVCASGFGNFSTYAFDAEDGTLR